MAISAFLLLRALTACGDEPAGDTAPLPVEGDPEIELDPSSVTFEALKAGEKDEAKISIRNIGSGTLHVTDLSISEATGSISIVNPPETLEIAPGAAHGIKFGFSPTLGGEIVATFQVLSDAVNAPTAEATLSGWGLYGVLSAQPSPLDFGALPTGCTIAALLVLSNTGEDVLEMTEMTAGGGEFSMAPVELPWLIAPGETFSVEISFSPTAPGVQEGVFTVVSDEVESPREVVLRGEGVEAEEFKGAKGCP